MDLISLHNRVSGLLRVVGGRLALLVQGHGGGGGDVVEVGGGHCLVLLVQSHGGDGGDGEEGTQDYPKQLTHGKDG